MKKNKKVKKDHPWKASAFSPQEQAKQFFSREIPVLEDVEDLPVVRDYQIIHEYAVASSKARMEDAYD